MLKHITNLCTFTVIALFVTAMFAPDIDETQGEVSDMKAYRDVQVLQNEYKGEAPREPLELEQIDPWGSAYVAQMMDDGQIRVSSAGSNGVFDSLDTNSDDIWSDMPTSPAERFRLQRKWGWIRALSVGSTVFCLFVAAYWWSVRFETNARHRNAHQ